MTGFRCTVFCFLMVVTAGCLDRAPEPNNNLPGPVDDTTSFNWTARTVGTTAVLLEVTFGEPTACDLEYEFAGSTEENPIFYLMGMRWPKSQGVTSEWGWGFGLPAAQVQFLDQQVAGSLPGPVWTLVGKQIIRGGPADTFVFLAALHSATTTSLSFICDKNVQATLSEASEIVPLSPGALSEGASLQTSRVGVSQAGAGFELDQRIAVVGCYYPLGSPMGSHDLSVGLPSGNHSFAFEGQEIESVYLQSEPGSVNVELSSVSSESYLILEALNMEQVSTS